VATQEGGGKGRGRGKGNRWGEKREKKKKGRFWSRKSSKFSWSDETVPKGKGGGKEGRKWPHDPIWIALSLAAAGKKGEKKEVSEKRRGGGQTEGKILALCRKLTKKNHRGKKGKKKKETHTALPKVRGPSTKRPNEKKRGGKTWEKRKKKKGKRTED